MSFTSNPSLCQPTSAEAPQSTSTLRPAASSRKQVWNRPPLPQASAHPTMVTFMPIALSSCLPKPSHLGPSRDCRQPGHCLQRELGPAKCHHVGPESFS